MEDVAKAPAWINRKAAVDFVTADCNKVTPHARLTKHARKFVDLWNPPKEQIPKADALNEFLRRVPKPTPVTDKDLRITGEALQKR